MKELTKESIGIIDQFLNFTITGDIGLHSVSLSLIFEKLKKKYKAKIEEQEGHWIVDFKEEKVLADEILLEQVLSNIISNSLKTVQFSGSFGSSTETLSVIIDIICFFNFKDLEFVSEIINGLFI